MSERPGPLDGTEAAELGADLAAVIEAFDAELGRPPAPVLCASGVRWKVTGVAVGNSTSPL